MGAVGRHAEDLGDAFDAELRPSGHAMRAHAAAIVMVLHHAHAEARLPV
jgi:hypothetical protein